MNKLWRNCIIVVTAIMTASALGAYAYTSLSWPQTLPPNQANFMAAAWNPNTSTWVNITGQDLSTYWNTTGRPYTLEINITNIGSIAFTPVLSMTPTSIENWTITLPTFASVLPYPNTPWYQVGTINATNTLNATAATFNIIIAPT